MAAQQIIGHIGQITVDAEFIQRLDPFQQFHTAISPHGTFG
jgi:hypothetical protein